MDRRRFLTLGAMGAAALVGPPLSAYSLRSPASGSDLLSQIKHRGYITAAMFSNPPMCVLENNGSYKGFNADLLEAMAKSLHVKLHMENTVFETVIAGLQAGKYDIIGGSISATAQRKQSINFTTGYYNSGQNFWVLKNNSKHLKSISDLNKSSVTIAFSANSIEGEIAQKLAPSATQKSLPNPSTGDLIAEIESGRSDAFVINSSLYYPLTKKYPNFRALPNNAVGVNPTPVSWGLRKGSDSQSLLNTLNKFIAKEQKSGFLKELARRDLTPANSGL